jgi:putative transposase
MEIAHSYDIMIDEMEVSSDHVHIFSPFPPRYSIAQVIGMFKGLSARAVFREFPQVKRQLWGGEFWEDGYFARTVGDKVTAEMIRKYIQRHKEAEDAQINSVRLNRAKAPLLAVGSFYSSLFLKLFYFLRSQVADLFATEEEVEAGGLFQFFRAVDGFIHA